MENIRLIVYHLNQDDPKKCTAKKMERFGLAEIVNSNRNIPRRSIILNPLAGIVFSKEDKDYGVKYGIVAVDCSWEKADYVFSKLRNFRIQRALPFLVAVNPVNYGKPFKFTTLEAFIASLYLLEEYDQVKKLENLYKWSPYFIEINKKYLDAYTKTSSKEELIEKMKTFVKYP